MAKIVFLDRDGVINRFPGYGDYVKKVKDFHFLSGVFRAIKILTKRNYKIFVISNQAGVAKGVYTKAKLAQITRFMLRNIKKKGGRITKVFYCIHRQDQNCECRKPNIGSIKKAFQVLRKAPSDARQSFFIGDAQSDIEAGHRAGCRTILVLSGKEGSRRTTRWKIKPDYVAKNLLDAVRILENEDSGHSRVRRSRTYQSRRSNL